MTPFRNFLAKRSTAPNSGEVDNNNDISRLSTDSHQSSPLSIRKSTDNEPPVYKLSVVDDNGAYLPPSPPEKQNFWRRYPGSNRSSNNHRDLVDENEPFSISRESFDSYRRSFDISARSPVSYSDVLPSRTSLDSRFSRLPSPYERSPRKQPTSMEEEHFEEVGLDDDNEAKPKKKGIFSRFGDFTTNDSHISTNSKLGFHLPGRKRGQSNVGSEMGCIKTPPAVETEVRDA